MLITARTAQKQNTLSKCPNSWDDTRRIQSCTWSHYFGSLLFERRWIWTHLITLYSSNCHQGNLAVFKQIKYIFAHLLSTKMASWLNCIFSTFRRIVHWQSFLGLSKTSLYVSALMNADLSFSISAETVCMCHSKYQTFHNFPIWTGSPSTSQLAIVLRIELTLILINTELSRAYFTHCKYLLIDAVKD